MTPDPWKIKELIQQTFSNELRLLIYFCSPDEPDETILSVLSKKCNWKIFLNLIDRHRLLPFLASRKKLLYSMIPAEESAKVDIKLDSHKHTALFRTNEVFRICRLFEQNNLAIMPIKGPCLAWQLYGDVTSRLSHDLDFLINESNPALIKNLMEKSGYNLINVFSPRQTAYFYSNLTHHFSLYNNENKTLAEFHFKLFLYKNLFPVSTKEIFLSTTASEIAGNKVRLMNDEDLIIYLCLHGGEHFWFRLHWLRDIAQIIYTKKIHYKNLISKAVRLKIEKPVCEGLLLAASVFNLNILDSAYQDIINYSSAWFIKQSIYEIQDVPYELKSRRLKVIFSKLRGMYHLRNDFTYRIHILPFFKTTPSDWEKIKLPDSLFFLYKILHPFIWACAKLTGKY
jgi:hypothetical protein